MARVDTSVPLQSNANGRIAPVVDGEQLEKENANVLEEDPVSAATIVPNEVGTGCLSMTLIEEAQKVTFGDRKTVMGMTVIAHVSIGVGTEPVEQIALLIAVPPPFFCALNVSVKPAAHLIASTGVFPIERDTEVDDVETREQLPVEHFPGSIGTKLIKFHCTLGDVVHPGV